MPMTDRNTKFIFAAAALASASLVWVGVQKIAPDGSATAFVGEAFAAEKATVIPAPNVNVKETGKSAVAIFAGGCFWGVEGVFENTKGVASATSGYHGGTKATADYEMVSSGPTSHAEAVRVVYDPQQISYGKLMQIYFSVITDPTMLNAQGPDRGAQYRSAIVPMNAAQANAAKAYIAQLGKGGYWSKPIVTKIESSKSFYPAESYHQNFMQKNPRNGYIMRWDAPKVVNLKQHFPAYYRKASAK